MPIMKRTITLSLLLVALLLTATVVSPLITHGPATTAHASTGTGANPTVPIANSSGIRNGKGSYSHPYEIYVSAEISDASEIKGAVRNYLLSYAGGTDMPPRYGEYYVRVVTFNVMFHVSWSQTENVSLTML